MAAPGLPCPMGHLLAKGMKTLRGRPMAYVPAAAISSQGRNVRAPSLCKLLLFSLLIHKNSTSNPLRMPGLHLRGSLRRSHNDRQPQLGERNDQRKKENASILSSRRSADFEDHGTAT